MFRDFVVVVALAAGAQLRGDDKTDNGFVPMFNGKDLTGWVNVNCAPGTFFVKDGEVITTGKPTGYLRTAKQYENFIAEFDWMHINRKEVGNSGFFVWADPLPGVGTPYTRGIEVQVLVNLEKEGYYTSQGDLFSIHGATCKPDRPHPHGWARCLPSENRCKGGGEWNHYKVIGNNGVLKLHVNGKEVSGLSECRPRKGYLALESEGAECHFRNLRIKELPSSNPKPEEVADLARGFKNLFTGLDLSGWKTDDEEGRHWRVRDWVLRYDGKGRKFETERTYADAEFIVDFRFPKGGKPDRCAVVLRRGKRTMVSLLVTPNDQKASVQVVTTLADGGHVDASRGSFKEFKPPGQWNRLHATLLGQSLELNVNGKPAFKVDIGAAESVGTFGIGGVGELEFGNLFVRDLKRE
jgi:hypothetical protein